MNGPIQLLRRGTGALALLSTLTLQPATLCAQGTAFTYQGRLNDGGSPANGTYNLTFALFNVTSGGSAVAGPLTNSAVAVTNGLFVTLIDFGSGVFTGTNYWLEIGVETNGGSAFTTLSPRQQLTPTPYAVFANTASNLNGTLPVAQLSGLILDNQLNHSAVTVNPGPGLSGGGRVTLGNTIVLTNTGVLSVAGNADITATTVGGAVTLGDTGTNSDTASTLVKRDGSGNFSAASITLDGTLTLPDVALGNPNIVYSGLSSFLYGDNNGNFFGGNGAGNPAPTSSFNTAVGYQAFAANTSGYQNTVIGYHALNANTSGRYNTAIGSQALYANTNGTENIAIGAGTLFANTSGSDNTAVGTTALQQNTTGANNTASGWGALISNTTGSDNTADGSSTLVFNTNGIENTAIGNLALFSNANGNNNTAVGSTSLYLNTSGSDNTAVGHLSLRNSTTGSNNIALGDSAGLNITTGSDNIDIGNEGLSTDTNIIRIGTSQTQTYIAGVLLPPPPVLVQTNFIDGHRYTNNYGWPLTINATVVLNTAAVVGTANESFCIQASPSVGGTTNVCAISTTAASSVLHYTNCLSGFVPTNAIYWFTNLSSGSGNSAVALGGQIKYP